MNWKGHGWEAVMTYFKVQHSHGATEKNVTVRIPAYSQTRHIPNTSQKCWGSNQLVWFQGTLNWGFSLYDNLTDDTANWQ